MHTALVARLLKDRAAWELAHVPVASAAASDAKPKAEQGFSEAALAGA
jgi:hypothetical protein